MIINIILGFGIGFLILDYFYSKIKIRRLESILRKTISNFYAERYDLQSRINKHELDVKNALFNGEK